MGVLNAVHIPKGKGGFRVFLAGVQLVTGDQMRGSGVGYGVVWGIPFPVEWIWRLCPFHFKKIVEVLTWKMINCGAFSYLWRG